MLCSYQLHLNLAMLLYVIRYHTLGLHRLLLLVALSGVWFISPPNRLSSKTKVSDMLSDFGFQPRELHLSFLKLIRFYDAAGIYFDQLYDRFKN